MIWLLAVGLVSILGQVVLLRELHVAFFGSELVYILALGVWLLGTAAGAAAGRRAHVPSSDRVRCLLLLWSVLLPLMVAFVRGHRVLLGAVPGAYLPFPLQLAIMGAVLLPVSALLGLLFQGAAKRYVEGSRTLAVAYAIESGGSILGGILAAVLLMAGAQNLSAALLCGLLGVAAALHPWNRRPRWLAPEAALAAHHEQRLRLAPPTFVTVSWLLGLESAAGARERLAPAPLLVFRPHICRVEEGACMLYPGDAGYEASDPAAAGARHRLWTLPSGWRYERT